MQTAQPLLRFSRAPVRRLRAARCSGKPRLSRSGRGSYRAFGALDGAGLACDSPIERPGQAIRRPLAGATHQGEQSIRWASGGRSVSRRVLAHLGRHSASLVVTLFLGMGGWSAHRERPPERCGSQNTARPSPPHPKNLDNRFGLRHDARTWLRSAPALRQARNQNTEPRTNLSPSSRGSPRLGIVRTLAP